MATNLADTGQTGDGRKSVDEVVIRFAGDSGDGMQLTGTQFTQSTALMGNDPTKNPSHWQHGGKWTTFWRRVSRKPAHMWTTCSNM